MEEVVLVVRAKAGTAVVHSCNLNMAVSPSLCTVLRGRRVQQTGVGTLPGLYYDEPGNDWEDDEEGSIGQSATPEEVVVRAKAGTAVVHSRKLNVAVYLCAALRGRRVQHAALVAEERAKLLSMNLLVAIALARRCRVQRYAGGQVH
jgi:hypothetical protein